MTNRIEEMNLKRNACYRGIPCWYNPITDEIKGKNWMYDHLISIVIWFDTEILMIEAFPLWVEVDDLEKG